MKNRFKYGIKEYFRPTPAKVKRLLLFWKGIVASSAVVAYEQSGLKATIIVGIIGFLINEACEFVGEHPEFFAVEEAKNALKDKVEEVAEEAKHTLEVREDEVI